MAPDDKERSLPALLPTPSKEDIDSKINYHKKLPTVCARVLDVPKMRLNAGELVELAGVKDFNDY
jgi:hypothetical protein